MVVFAKFVRNMAQKGVQIINARVIDHSQRLPKVIDEYFGAANGKYFYSIEITPKDDLRLDFTELSVLPLFVALTWIKDDNLSCADGLKGAPTACVTRLIRSSFRVNHLSCYKLTDHQLQEFLDLDEVDNISVVRGGCCTDRAL